MQLLHLVGFISLLSMMHGTTNIKAYGEHTLSRSQVFKWYKAFSEGRESIKDEPRSGRPTSKTDNNVDKVRALVRSDRRLTVRMIASDLNLNHTTVHQILTQELTMRK